MSDAASTEQQALHLKELAGTLNNARDSLRAGGVIPDVLDDFNPTCRLQVLYPENHKEVLMGNQFNVTDAQHAPIVTVTCPGVSEADLGKYTVVLTDPDAPSRDDPKWSEFCHWIGKMPPSGVLQADLPKEALEKHKAAAAEKKVSDEAVEYMGPAPPKGTGPHRYVFVLLHGDPSKITPPPERKTWGTGKARHGVKQWAAKEGLDVVGANFFYAENKGSK